MRKVYILELLSQENWLTSSQIFNGAKDVIAMDDSPVERSILNVQLNQLYRRGAIERRAYSGERMKYIGMGNHIPRYEYKLLANNRKISIS